MKTGFLRYLPLLAAAFALTTGTTYADTITIVESTPNRHENQTFEFTGGLGAFSLDDNGNNGDALPNSITFSPALGTYAVAQSEVINWSLLSLSCTGDTDAGTTVDVNTRVATIDLDAGEDITCTFVNDMTSSNVSEDEILATIKIIKDSRPDSDHEFFFLSDFGSFTLDDDGNPDNNRSNVGVFRKPIGYYNVEEFQDTGWNLTEITCEDPDNGTTVDLEKHKALIDLDKDEVIVCIFTNQSDDYIEENGGSDDEITTDDENGDDQDDTNEEDDDTSDEDDNDNESDVPEYTGISCSNLLGSWIHVGWSNDPAEVTKLQIFLNENLGLSLEVNGIYDAATVNAVNQFQLTYADQILAPWGITAPTGFVYLTTQRWINMTACEGLDIPMPELIPYNQR